MLFTLLLILTAIWIVTAGLADWRRVAAASSEQAAEDLPGSSGALPDEGWPRVSVVAYALRDEEALSDYLDILLSQDYPELEVVLVCDASAEATAMIAERFADARGLHVTFIPPGSHNLSRRKLAQTIGIKAAKGDVVILTSTSVVPVSGRWVRDMVLPFRQDTSTAASLGHMRIPIEDFSGHARWYRQFDYILDSSSRISAALRGDAYRGDGCDLALRRECFFSNKGYAATISLMDGDDDIFIREIARFGAIRACLSPDSAVVACRGDRTDAFYIDLKDRRLFTRRYLPRRPFVRQGLLAAMQWAMALLLPLSLATSAILLAGAGTCPALLEICAAPVIGAWTGASSGAPLAIASGATALAATLAACGAEIAAYRRMASALGAVRLFWAVPLFMLWRPIADMLFRINHRTTRKSHFTWQR